MQQIGDTKQLSEIGVKELVVATSGGFRYLLRNWKIIAFATVLGGLMGLAYSYLTPQRYTARNTFAVEEAQSTAGLASLAGQFGVSLGGSGGGGIFTGDNILLFFRSQQLVRETLLTQFNDAPQTLADRYIQSYDLRRKWSKSPEAQKVDFFATSKQPMNRVADSVLQLITKRILKDELSVDRPNIKASFVEVRSTMRDEVLSKLFCDRLVAVALDKYVQSKIKLKVANVAMLQRRADSLESLLNARTFTAAASQQTLLDINPGLRSMSAAPEIKTRQKATAAAIYTEVVKNLELAKTIMNQQTPTIEVVDQSSFPLVKEKPSKALVALTVAISFAVFTVFVMLLRRWLRSLTL